jgi:hypothetical protein
VAAPLAPATESPTVAAAITPVLRRLVAVGGAPAGAVVAAGTGFVQPEFAWAGAAAVNVGTVVHRALQRLAEEGLEHWHSARVQAQREAFARELELLGVEPRELAAASERVAAALEGALADPNGRWILGRHEEARAELRLTIGAGTALEHVRLDRTFVADGRRWIVDFKTSSHEGGELSEFLDSEVARYAPQLERYARAVAALDTRPVQLALYFPLLGALRSWPAAVTASPSS